MSILNGYVTPECAILATDSDIRHPTGMGRISKIYLLALANGVMASRGNYTFAVTVYQYAASGGTDSMGIPLAAAAHGVDLEKKIGLAAAALPREYVIGHNTIVFVGWDTYADRAYGFEYEIRDGKTTMEKLQPHHVAPWDQRIDDVARVDLTNPAAMHALYLRQVNLLRLKDPGTAGISNGPMQCAIVTRDGITIKTR